MPILLDQVTFPRMSLRGKRFVVAGARGGTYLPGTPRAGWLAMTTTTSAEQPLFVGFLAVPEL